MGETLEDRNCFVKFLVDKDDKILGRHIISSCASILIHEVLLVAMRLGTGITNIAKINSAHPPCTFRSGCASCYCLWINTQKLDSFMHYLREWIIIYMHPRF
jgi:hypothetical protein